MALPSPVAAFPDMSAFVADSQERAKQHMNNAWIGLSQLGASPAAAAKVTPEDLHFGARQDPIQDQGSEGYAEGLGHWVSANGQKTYPTTKPGSMEAMILETAEAAGVDPLDLATAISYETAGTFDPMKAGPTTQWGQHRGLIQFGEPQAKQYGVDFSSPEAALRSQLGRDGAIVKYLRASGFKPGMSGLDLYSTINAGSPGRYSASDANNGGAPGTVADKWNRQMAEHRRKAAARLGLS